MSPPSLFAVLIAMEGEGGAGGNTFGVHLSSSPANTAYCTYGPGVSKLQDLLK